MGGRVIIAGGSGFLGVTLGAHLARKGFEVVTLSRGARSVPGRHEVWDGRTLGAWAECFEGAAGLVNLAGRSVNCVKTPDHRDEILRSRVESTRVLGLACRAARDPPPVWVQMSTAHIYGDPPSARCDEDSATGHGLAPEVGRAWEAAFAAALLPSQRGVAFRTSFVVGRPNAGGRGALGTLLPLARLGLGGAVGSGRQGMSWIHELDLNRLFERALGESAMRGTYVASSPNPAPQREFMRELRRTAGGLSAIGLPSPAWLVRIGAGLVLRTDPELALYGRFVVSRRLREEGFEFRFPALGEALADLLADRGSKAFERPT